MESYGKELDNLGFGSFSTVSLFKKDSIEYAIKQINYETEGENEIDSPSLNEMSIILSMNHPNIINIVDILWKPNESLSIVMPIGQPVVLNDGLNTQVINRDYNLDYLYQIGSGIAYLHSRGIYHLDLKPENLIIINNIIKIIDFNISKSKVCSEFPIPNEDVVTLFYRPPELLLGGSISDKVDVWSFACIIYYFYNNMTLFSGYDEIVQLLAIFKILGTPNSNIWPNAVNLPRWYTKFPIWKDISRDYFKQLSPFLIRLLRNMLVLDPSQRFNIYQVMNDDFFQEKPSISSEKIACDDMLFEYSIRITDIKYDNIYNIIDEIIFNIEWLSIEVLYLTLRIIDRYSPTTFNNTIFLAAFRLSLIYLDENVNNVMEEIKGKNMEITDSQLVDVINQEVSIIQSLKFNLLITTEFDLLNFYSLSYPSGIHDIAEDILPILSFSSARNKYNIKELALSSLAIACRYKGSKFLHEEKLLSISSVHDILTLQEYLDPLIDIIRHSNLVHFTNILKVIYHILI